MIVREISHLKSCFFLSKFLKMDEEKETTTLVRINDRYRRHIMKACLLDIVFFSLFNHHCIVTIGIHLTANQLKSESRWRPLI